MWHACSSWQPTLQFYSSNPRNSAANIRGLGAPFGLTNDGIEQGVGLYVDDVYYCRAASSTLRLPRRGAHRSAARPAGHAVRQEHDGRRDQHHHARADLRHPKVAPKISVGNLGFKQAKAALSGPLSTTRRRAPRLSCTNRHGTIYNVATRQPVNEQDNLGVRGPDRCGAPATTSM